MAAANVSLSAAAIFVAFQVVSTAVTTCPTLPSVSLTLYNVITLSEVVTLSAEATSNAATALDAAFLASYQVSTVVLSIEIVPDEVIVPPVKPVPVATEVTVPLGSSPDGITTHSVPLEIIISPTLHAGSLL